MGLRGDKVVEHELDGEIGVVSGMQDQVIERKDEVQVEDYQVMAYGHACSTKDARTSTSRTVDVMGTGLSGDVGGTPDPSARYRPGLRSGDGRVGAKDAVWLVSPARYAGTQILMLVPGPSLDREMVVSVVGMMFAVYVHCFYVFAGVFFQLIFIGLDSCSLELFSVFCF